MLANMAEKKVAKKSVVKKVVEKVVEAVSPTPKGEPKTNWASAMKKPKTWQDWLDRQK